MQAGSIPVRFSKKSPLLTAYSRTNCQQSTDPVLADSDAKRVSILKHIYSTLVGKAPIGSIPKSVFQYGQYYLQVVSMLGSN